MASLGWRLQEVGLYSSVYRMLLLDFTHCIITACRRYTYIYRPLGQGLECMRAGLRDLSQVTRGVDAYSAAVLETLLLKLKQLERGGARDAEQPNSDPTSVHMSDPTPDDAAPPQGEGTSINTDTN